MPTELDEWRGLLGSRSDSGEVLLIEQPLKPSVEGGSGVFLARADDGRRWWVKPQNNLQGAKVVVTEYLVGSLGGLIGAPVCEVAIAQIPEEIVGWEFRPGAILQAGLAHASRDVEDAQLLHALDYRQQSYRAKTPACRWRLSFWCWGGDDQWLYCHTEEHKLYSHDHGWYLPETGPDWSEATLLSRVDEPHPPGYSKEGLNTGAIERIAGQLEQVDKKKLLRILRSVPTTWAVTDTDLEALGLFLERRAPAVADRLRSVWKRLLVRYMYSVVRFVPDPGRGEFINVGAIVGSEESSEWQVRQIENPKRARFIDDHRTLPVVWSFLDRVGRVIDDYEEAVNRLLDPPIDLSEAWLKHLYVEHRNIVQLSPQTPMVASNAEEALERVFEELIVDPAGGRKGTQNKHTALAAVRRSYRENHIGKENLQERATLQTKHHHRERVDFAVTNGRVVQITHTWSFQVADQDELAEQIKAWGWTIRDARESGGALLVPDATELEVDEGVDVEVVYVQPRRGERSPAWEDALHVFEALNARYVPLEKAAEVGRKAHELLASKSH